MDVPPFFFRYGTIHKKPVTICVDVVMVVILLI